MMDMTDGFTLSVLDLVTIGAESTPAAAVSESAELARRTEELGYHRYWVAEHHNMPGIGSSSPAVLIGHLADATQRIRVGSGGVMLPNHPPLVVAEQFGLISSMHPGRIDLGIGRAPGTDPATAAALRRQQDSLSAEDFPQHLSELTDYLTGQGVGSTQAVPTPAAAPPIWLLGSSGFSAQLAGMLGLPFAFAHHFSSQNTLPALRLYREHFRPSDALSTPYAMVCASVTVADSDEHARWIAGPGALSFLQLRQGNPIRLPTPRQAADYPYTDMDRQFVEDRMASQIIGGPERVRDGVHELLERTQADELMVTTMVHDAPDRVRSYELLAEILPPKPPEWPSPDREELVTETPTTGLRR
jgi:luciferase family oxidoreductase group 1